MFHRKILAAVRLLASCYTHMNSIRSRAEEIIYAELVYV